MAYFNRDNNRDGGKRFGKRGFGQGNRFGGGQKPFMHKATCAECGKECEVPFKPVPGRPVYCSDCFGKRGNSNPRSDFHSPERNLNKQPFEKNYNGNNPAPLKEQLDQLNTKLDKILLALAAASASEPATEKVTKEKVKAKKVKPAPKAKASKKKVKV